MADTRRSIADVEHDIEMQGPEPQMFGQEPSEEEIVREVYEFAAGQMMNGASAREVRASLIHNGLDSQSAGIVVSNLVKMRSDAVAAAGKKEMLYGALWCIGGIAVTAGTYAAASNGGPYIIAFGAIIFGAIQFFRGLVQWLRK
jgi:hypothetical protein